MWKFCGVLCLVCSVLLLWTCQLKEQNETLEAQNCTLQQTLEANAKAAEEKQKRSKDELERLQKELNGLRNLDHDWSSTALPVSVHNRVLNICNGYRNACSALGTASN